MGVDSYDRLQLSTIDGAKMQSLKIEELQIAKVAAIKGHYLVMSNGMVY